MHLLVHFVILWFVTDHLTVYFLQLASWQGIQELWKGKNQEKQKPEKASSGSSVDQWLDDLIYLNKIFVRHIATLPLSSKLLISYPIACHPSCSVACKPEFLPRLGMPMTILFTRSIWQLGLTSSRKFPIWWVPLVLVTVFDALKHLLFFGSLYCNSLCWTMI